jgi:hypothetical protein
MKTKLAILSATIFSTSAFATELSATCQKLLEKTKNEVPQFQELTRVYKCGPKVKHIKGQRVSNLDACLLFYTVPAKGSHKWDVATTKEFGAYIDEANGYLFTTADRYTGIETGERNACAPFVKIIAYSKEQEPKVPVKLSHETDNYYCPFYKTYTHYEVTCEQVSPDPATTWPPKPEIPQANPAKKPAVPPVGACEKVRVTGGPNEIFYGWEKPDHYFEALNTNTRGEYIAVALLKLNATYWVTRKSGKFLSLEGSANNLSSFWVHSEQVECM